MLIILQSESNKLPYRLHSWLLPSDGSSRDLATIQVSLGSHDEFFASDKTDKISSRDLLDSVPSPMPSRKKAHTVSSSTPEESFRGSESTPVASRLVRRRTDLFTKTDMKTETGRNDRRRSISVGRMPVRQSREEWKIPLRLNLGEELHLRKKGYVDAAVQTENPKVGATRAQGPRTISHQQIGAPVVYVYVEARNSVSIGSMQHFCRTQQYSLGDALGYV